MRFPNTKGAQLEDQLGHRMRVLTSNMDNPVFGSSIDGTRPFGFMDSYGSFFMSGKSIILCSYLRPSSSRRMATFHGFGPWDRRKHMNEGAAPRTGSPRRDRKE